VLTDPHQCTAIHRQRHAGQRLVYERAINAPIWELAFLNGVGPRVGESSLGKIPGFPYTAPFEDITIKGS
jgi:peptide/nickel transport system substrate-binding protein